MRCGHSVQFTVAVVSLSLLAVAGNVVTVHRLVKSPVTLCSVALTMGVPVAVGVTVYSTVAFDVGYVAVEQFTYCILAPLPHPFG